MARHERVDVKAILADPDLRRTLMVRTIQATQAREGIETTEEQAERAYYVVSEGERTAFYSLERFRGGRKGDTDRRHHVFVQHLRSASPVRFDVARRDFQVIEGSPLVYQGVHVLAGAFEEHPPLEMRARVHQGVITRDDSRFLRYSWEVTPHHNTRPWPPIHKGGGFCRFYYDTELVIDWAPSAQHLMHRLRDTELYFNEGLSWPLRTQRGFNVRYMPDGCVFSHKGGGVLLSERLPVMYVLGVLNSSFVEYVARSLTSFGSWEVRVLRAIPMPEAGSMRTATIERLSRSIHDRKADWDSGNEISTRFARPWMLRVDESASVPARLDLLDAQEQVNEAELRSEYATLNDEVYRLYGIPDSTRRTIEATLGERPPEVIWPQMEGKTAEQKRMEHVWRLLSYVVKRVVEADADGIVPCASLSGETSLLDRVHEELAALFPEQDVNQVEVEIVNELKRRVKGYRPAASIREWLENAYFDYHAALYKRRPIVWHVASSQGAAPFAFGALCHYHKFDANRMAKLRSGYLRDAIETFRREAALAEREGRAGDRIELQARLEEAQGLDRKLQAVQEGRRDGPEGGDRDYRLLTPWKSAEERPSGWDPDVDDGVKVNITPLQKAGVLRSAKVV